jgi:hypothetical protein
MVVRIIEIKSKVNFSLNFYCGFFALSRSMQAGTLALQSFFMQLKTIKTPSLIVDFRRMKRNAERISNRAKELNVNLRPHVKTHR